MRHIPLRRRVAAACTGVVAVGALTLAGLTGSATAAPETRATPASAPDAALLRAMERDLGLTAAEARQRIAGEAAATDIAATLKKRLGASFAGARVTGDGATLIVATTDPAERRAITAAGARAELAGHGLAKLEAAKAGLDAAAGRRAPEGVPLWYVDTTASRVVLQATDRGAADRFAAAAGVDRDLVKVVRASEEPRTYADLRGGDAYYMGGSGRCSVGFPVKRGASQAGFVTAGHCGTVGTTTTGVNQQAQGSFQGSTFPGRDYAWVATNANWTPRNLVNGYGNADVTVAGSTQALVGASICRSGSTTGWRCGTVQQLNTSVTYPQGTVSGVTRTSVCAEPGDSGGSFISGNQAQGMTSGGSGNCSQGGTTYFQPLAPALSAYGLTLVTSNDGGGPGPTDPPTEPGGTWAAGTSYAVGATVTYGGATYRCLQAHTAQAGWQPPNTPSLWQRV
ncbi:carbohydrate-binding protein [Streptomyces albidoflavus]